MKMMIIFDCDADVIDVPEFVVDNRETFRRQFLKWIYDKNSHHKYWEKVTDREGNQFVGLSYRSDAFVDWLNKKKLKNNAEKASIYEQYVPILSDTLPTIEF